MNVTSERSGVYTSYQVSNVSYSTLSRGVVGAVAQASTGSPATVYEISSAADAKRIFGSCNLTRLIQAALNNGAATVAAIPIFSSTTPSESMYATAFARLAKRADVQVIICDSSASGVHAAMKAAITDSDNTEPFKIGVVEISGSVSSTVSDAANLDCERMVMVAPNAAINSNLMMDIPILSAALAGAIVSEVDPARPLNGAELVGIDYLTMPLSEGEINSLVRGGVCPVEMSGGRVRVIRGVTTRTTDGNGANDPTWHELTTVRIVDNVVPEVRNTLRTMFQRAKNTAQTRDAIRTQVVVVLEKKIAAEIIDSYGNVSVTQDASDPTICNVSFEFAVAHGLNKIVLTANITV